MTHGKSGAQAASTPQESTPSYSPARLAHAVGDLILDKKGENLVVIDVEKVTSLADLIVVATGTSRRHVLAMATEIHAMAKQRGLPLLGEEGFDQGWWILIDLGDVVVHIMQAEAREYYDLEAIWGDGEVVRRMGSDDLLS